MQHHQAACSKALPGVSSSEHAPVRDAGDGVHARGDGDEPVLEDVLAVGVREEVRQLPRRLIHAPPLAAPPVTTIATPPWAAVASTDEFLPSLLQRGMLQAAQAVFREILDTCMMRRLAIQLPPQV